MSNNIIEVNEQTKSLLIDSATRQGMTLTELLDQIAGNEYERQQIESSKG